MGAPWPRRTAATVHYDLIARAVEAVPCPVLANGNVYSAAKADEVLAQTGARGLMIGRGVIRNPWLFAQIRQHRRGEPIALPTGRDVLGYIARCTRRCTARSRASPRRCRR